MHKFVYNIFVAALILPTATAISVAFYERPPLTFYTLLPFSDGENGFSFSVVSDSSLWYTTNRGVFHYDGKTATKVFDVSLFTKTQVEVFLIQALTDNDIWVLGHDAKTWEKTLYHFDGREWRRQEFPQYSSDPNDDLVLFRMQFIRVGNRHLGYAVGQEGLVYRYDGNKWSIVPQFTNQTLRALCVNDENDIWTGGKNNTVFHYNGERWSYSSVDDTAQQNYILDITFHGERDGWAAGTQGMLHYDGSVWRHVPLPVNTPIQSVLIISPTDGWASSGQGDLLHYDGVKWQQAGKISPLVLYGRINMTRSEDGYTLYLLSQSELWASYWGKVPSFTDISALSNIHLEGGIPLTADFDGNRTDDLLTPSFLAYPDRLYSNRGDGFFTEMTERLHQIANATAFQITVGDVDNNGYPDVVALKIAEPDEWYSNKGGWKFEPKAMPTDLSMKADRNITSLADMDNDGDLDILFLYTGADNKTAPLTIYYNDGIGNFVTKVGIGKEIEGGGSVMSFFVADLTGDNRRDIFKYNVNAKSEFYVNNGDGTFNERAKEAGLDCRYFEDYPFITWAYPIDINHDDALDVFVVWRKGKSAFFMNNGLGRFTPGESIEYDPQGMNPIGSFVDVDADGDQDLFMLDRFYRNDNSKFTEYKTIKLAKRGSATFVDIDGDGDGEMVMRTANEGGRLYIYRNDFNPVNIATIKLKGIRSNSFGTGSKVTLWKKNYNGVREIADYREVLDQTPMHLALDTNVEYDLEVEFPSGIKILHENLKPTTLEVVEFSSAARYVWDFLYSFNRTLKYVTVTFELLKLLIVAVIVATVLWISSLTRTQKYFKTPLYFVGVILLYILCVHSTIRYGWLLSATVPVGSIAILSGGLLYVAYIVVRRREATYVSHYKLLEPLGEGGMGKVYKAVDDHSKQIVALKVLNPMLLQDPENRKRLMHEGQLLSSFSHANIVKVFEVSETQEHGYIAMEYLPGGTLKQRLDREHPIQLDEIKRLTLQVADGIAEIHAHGVIHRDIKTGNIMLDSDDTVRIMDFGLSKSPLVTTMTTLGTVIGTLGYVAPEQVTGLMVDHRVDIFSFGVVLYELLTARLPFTGENEIAVIHSIFNTIPPSPSSVRNDLSKELDSIVMKCLAKNADERFTSIVEVQTMLTSVCWKNQ